MSDDMLVKLGRGKRIALIATILTAMLAVIKYTAGVLYNSDVLIADAYHSLADTAAIFASAFGLFLAGKSKTDKFPYGLYKAETIALLFIGIFISYAGVDLTREGIKKIMEPQFRAGVPYIPVFVVIFSVIVSAFIAWWELKVSREIKSLSLEANAKESFLDLASSAVVFCGIIMPSLNFPVVEGVSIILIALLVLKIGLESTYRSILILLDANVHDELKKSIGDIICRIKGIKAVKGVFIREAGPFKMIDLKIEVSPSATVYAANELNEEITKRILENIDNIDEVIVDVKPAKNEIYRAVVPVVSSNGLRSIVFPHFGRSRYYAIVKITGFCNDIEIEDFYLNEFFDGEKHVGLNVVKSLINFNVDIIFTSMIGEISFYILKDNMIDIYKIEDDEKTIKDVIDAFLGGKLNKITNPTHSVDERMVSK